MRNGARIARLVTQGSFERTASLISRYRLRLLRAELGARCVVSSKVKDQSQTTIDVGHQFGREATDAFLEEPAIDGYDLRHIHDRVSRQLRLSPADPYIPRCIRKFEVRGDYGR